MSKGFPIVMAAVTFGALAIGTAAVVGAFLVVDHRAAEVLQAEPQIAPAAKKNATLTHSGRRTAGARPETVGSAAKANTAAPQSADRTATGETTPARGIAPDSRHERRADARHASRRQTRRIARAPQEPQDSGQFLGASPGSRDGGTSAFFFPFR